MKYILLVIASFLVFCAKAQNIQLHYDFGHSIYDELDGNRAPLTSTVEFFKPDKVGSTFFFVDMDYDDGVQSAYWEIARELCFWHDSPFAWLSAHAEYNGGLSSGVGAFNDAWLFGLTYSGHNADFSATWSLSAMYKHISHTVDLDGKKQCNNYQFTGVWNVDFADKWLTFSGFADFWRECRPWQNTTHIFMTEPQLWLNLNRLEKLQNVNLSIGSEVELSNNFVAKGFYAIPTVALKFTL